MSHRCLPAALLIAVSAVALTAQAPARFEVTSVRANTSGPRGQSMRFTPTGDFAAVNQPVRVLLNFAYLIPLFRVEGMPDWFTAERFDITAKAPAGLLMEPYAEVRGQLLRGLLEDRFKLKTRLVTKEMAAMVVTLARADGRLGPQLRQSDLDCDAVIAAAAAGRGTVAGPPPPAILRPCVLGGSSAGPICGRGVTLARLTQGLSGVYQREVVDRTGLQGLYDFDLTFTPDNPGGPGVSFGNPCGPLAGDRPAFSTAMLEQLGLKIESQRVPVEVLIVDSAERPTDN